MEYFVHQPENWNYDICLKKSKYVASDGLDTKMHFAGYIGNHYGKIRYNGGCYRNNQYYAGEIFSLPNIHPSFMLEYRRSWGWCIKRIK